MSVPVVLGERGWVHAGNLDAVADLLGIEPTGHRALPPEKLAEKYDVVLAAAQRYLRAFPPEEIHRTVPRRDQRDMRQLGYHVFAIADDLMTVKDGDTYRQGNGPVPGDVRSFDDVIAYGDRVRKRFHEWFAAQPSDAWAGVRTTSYGALPLHLYLERATWHSAQHSRQIVEMLKSAGVEAPEVLPAPFFEGLPMPKGVWD